MPAKRIKVRPVKTILVCNDCDGIMENTMVVFTTYPEQYQYKCPLCGAIQTSYIKYPYIDYVEEK